MLFEPQNDQQEATSAIFDLYASLSFQPPPKQFTVLASFYLTKRIQHGVAPKIGPRHSDSLKIISLSTGTKCMPASRYSPRGELVHDSHAEVLARRGALRWFLEEVGRIRTSPGYTSQWLARDDDDRLAGKLGEKAPYRLQSDVELSMYVSTLPCGDASMRYLASIQDAAMATLKSAHVFPTLTLGQASRGRDDYNRLGVLRTKPGRADSPPALSMSCSDKIARWTVVGIQGALASTLLEPLYIVRIVIGEAPREEKTRRLVREDCERALSSRVRDLKGLPEGYAVRPPEICFTDSNFTHCKTELDKIVQTTGSCNDSLCWIADSQSMEVLTNGLKRGTAPKNRYLERYRPSLSRVALFNLQNHTLNLEGLPHISEDSRYGDVKATCKRYQQAKAALIGPMGLFSGWITIDPFYQEFTISGSCNASTNT